MSPHSRHARRGPSRIGRILNVVGIILVAALFAVLAWGVFSGSIRSAGRRTFLPGTRTGASDAPGQPWEYDAKTDRYFDPRPGHHHWHAGHPPPPSDRGGPAPADAPATGPQGPSGP